MKVGSAHPMRHNIINSTDQDCRPIQWAVGNMDTPMLGGHANGETKTKETAPHVPKIATALESKPGLDSNL